MENKRPHKLKTLPITDSEKLELKTKIFNSIHKNRSMKKRLRLVFSMAASLILMLGLGWHFYQTPEESITDFVKSSDGVEPATDSDEVTLILGEGKNLKVDEKITAINYSSDGQKVTIGSTKEIDQATEKNNKTVYNTLLVPYGKRSKIKLSDGSMVWLNSGSKLVYPAVFNANKREVYLEGEAIFDVTHNKEKPFIVISDNQEIEVLGTVFGVTDYKDENTINTVLKTGSVQISYIRNAASRSNIDKMKITPGTKATYNKSKQSITSEKVNVDNYFSWRDGVLIFKNNDLRYIAKRLSRYYNLEISIESEDLANETFSGYLDLNENLDDVIDNIKASTNMDYIFTGDQIIIKKSTN